MAVLLLIYPPVAKSCEPPLGVALLSGALKEKKIDCKVIDANLEGLLWLAQWGRHPSDSWTKRAVNHYPENLNDLRQGDVYTNMGRYRQRVMDINRVMTVSLPDRFRLTLADYGDNKLTPLDSNDLLKSAKNFEENPFYPFFETVLKRRIKASGFGTIGISLCFLSQALTAYSLAGWVRARFPEKRIVMGGGLVTSWLSSPEWQNPFGNLIQTLVKGAGEDAVVAMAGGEWQPLSQAAPDFDFCDWESYIAPGRILPYRVSSGCYWGKCRFCPETAEKKGFKPLKNSMLLAELDLLCERYKPDYVHFLDNALTPAFLSAISKRVMPFTWYGFARFTKKLSDPDFCRDLYQSGCRMLNLGLESGDQDVLDAMRKGTDLKTASRILTSLKKAGIATYVYVLFGTLHEDRVAAKKTLAFVADHSDRIDFLNVAIFNLPRFGEEAPGLETKEFYGGDLSLYLNFTHPKGWERNKIRRFLDKEFKKHPDIAGVIRNDPPFFTSNHAMFVKPE